MAFSVKSISLSIIFVTNIYFSLVSYYKQLIFGTSFVFLTFTVFVIWNHPFPPRKGVVSFKKYKRRTAADLGVDEQVLGYVNSKKQTRVNLSTNTLRHHDHDDS